MQYRQNGLDLPSTRDRQKHRKHYCGKALSTREYRDDKDSRQCETSNDYLHDQKAQLDYALYSSIRRPKYVLKKVLENFEKKGKISKKLSSLDKVLLSEAAIFVYR